MIRRVLLVRLVSFSTLFFFFNDTATTEIYTLSLHDALPISDDSAERFAHHDPDLFLLIDRNKRSEEHTSELQSRPHLVCRLLLEKKKGNAENLGGAGFIQDGLRPHARHTAA